MKTYPLYFEKFCEKEIRDMAILFETNSLRKFQKWNVVFEVISYSLR